MDLRTCVEHGDRLHARVGPPRRGHRIGAEGAGESSRPSALSCGRLSAVRERARGQTRGSCGGRGDPESGGCHRRLQVGESSRHAPPNPVRGSAPGRATGIYAISTKNSVPWAWAPRLCPESDGQSPSSSAPCRRLPVSSSKTSQVRVERMPGTAWMRDRTTSRSTRLSGVRTSMTMSTSPPTRARCCT